MAVTGWSKICHAVPLASKCELFLFVHQLLQKENKNLIDYYSYKRIIEEAETASLEVAMWYMY